MPAAMWLVLLFLLWLSPVAPNWETGSCSQSQPLCCLGTDNHCKRGNCYCDEFCRVLSDCCPDHHTLCNPGNSHAGSSPPLKEPNAVIDRGKPLLSTADQCRCLLTVPCRLLKADRSLQRAPQNTKMVLQMVLRMENPPSLARSNLNWVQSMVSALEVLLERVGQSAPASLASRPQSQGTIY
ncbi:hypothetical protein QTO34_014550 [Cnephaeus nilssonii]|uniref:SMB domain-containing protein n=1 Tax=Cnephaeus nilssonii TaxID=3371016 RepID=A0AA40I7S5_CNENI|nr:hypothetical protein QTO34_014550 [Eptesicus nilssonii]